MAHRHFEGYLHAQIYGKYRPVPPLSLIQRVVGYVKEKYAKPLSTAYDVGCGTGQSTGFFASYFNNVIGTDVSPEQIKNAREHNKLRNVSFLVSAAEKFDNVPDSSVQLITACQAAHWFDLPSFYKETHRVLDKNAVLSLFGYEFPYFLTKDQRKNDLLRERLLHLYKTELENYVLPGSVQVYIGRYTDFYRSDLEGCWDEYRKYVDGKYSDRVFVYGDSGSERSGDDKLFRDFTREEGYFEDSETTLSDYIGYCHTWSGFQHFQKVNGEKAAADLMHRFKNDLEEIIGREEAQNQSFTKRTNFFLLLGRK